MTPAGAGAGVSARREGERRRAREAEVRRERRPLRRAGVVALACGAGLATAGGPGPAIAVLVGAGAVLVLVGVVWGGRATSGRWQAGAAGEEAVAAALAPLDGRRGVTVVHDVVLPGRRWNIDHLVAGRGRVTVVETKRWQGRIRVGRRGVRVDGRRRPEVLDQVLRSAAAVAASAEWGRVGEVAGFLCIDGPGASLRTPWWRRRPVRTTSGVVVGDTADLVRWLRRRHRVRGGL